LGDPLADLASTRLELLWAFGQQAMEQFTALYSLAHPLDTGNLAYYDLFAALEVAPKIENWGLAAATRRAMEDKLYSFAAAALAVITS